MVYSCSFVIGQIWLLSDDVSILAPLQRYLISLNQPVLSVSGRRTESADGSCCWLLAVDLLCSFLSNSCWMRHSCLSRSGKWNSVPDCWQILAKSKKINILHRGYLTQSRIMKLRIFESFFFFKPVQKKKNWQVKAPNCIIKLFISLCAYVLIFIASATSSQQHCEIWY